MYTTGEPCVKPRKCKVQNFGSWRELEFDFGDVGLAVIQGFTGSGKSTLIDILAWAVTGQTAKRGSVDEVCSWLANGNPTSTQLEITDIKGTDIVIFRSRGTSGKNDLYWTCSSYPEKQIRGKDLNDTQKLLETTLGISADTFLAGSYYHEFSPAAAFFTARAKDRRELFEKVCDLSFPLRLSARCIEEKRVSKDATASNKEELARILGSISSLSNQISDLATRVESWNDTQIRSASEFSIKAKTFEEEKANKIKELEVKSQDWEKKASDKIALLSIRLKELQTLIQPTKDFELQEAKARNESRCSTCGALPENISDRLEKIVADKFNNNQYISELKSIKKELKELGVALNPHEGALKAARLEINTYAEKAKEAGESENPFIQQLQDTEKALYDNNLAWVDAKVALERAQHRHSSLEHLYDLSFELRGQMINTVIREIQDETNRYLEAYFDAELRVTFQSKDADNLEVSIQKSGYACVFTQLSKGQRQLLRLCFSLAVMKSTANSAGVNFSTIMIDEGLDGLDTNLKLKAFRLLQELANDHFTVLVIDHSPDLALLFDKKYHVALRGDYSQLESESH